MTTLIRGESEDRAGLGISSVIDTWVEVSNLEIDGERNRGISILKSRGMGHSNQVREFQITSLGFAIRDVYAGERGVLMGSARQLQEARERAEALAQAAELDAKRLRLEYRRSAQEAQVAALRAQLEAETLELSNQIAVEERREGQVEQDREAIAAARRRAGDSTDGHGKLTP
jgi:circadian clock protein KaiC